MSPSERLVLDWAKEHGIGQHISEPAARDLVVRINAVLLIHLSPQLLSEMVERLPKPEPEQT